MSIKKYVIKLSIYWILAVERASSARVVSTGCFGTEYDVLFFNIKKKYLSLNIFIDLILKTIIIFNY